MRQGVREGEKGRKGGREVCRLGMCVGGGCKEGREKGRREGGREGDRHVVCVGRKKDIVLF